MQQVRGHDGDWCGQSGISVSVRLWPTQPSEEVEKEAAVDPLCSGIAMGRTHDYVDRHTAHAGLRQSGPACLDPVSFHVSTVHTGLCSVEETRKDT